MARPSTPAVVALAVALLAGCRTAKTTVLTDDSEALVWVDGRFTGLGVGTVGRSGPPHTARVLVTAPDGRRGRAIMHREFTSRTADSGLRTLGFCLAFCWEYPATIKVDLPPPRPKSGWAIDPESDPWLLAPGAGPSPWDAPPRWAPPPAPQSAPPEGAPPASPPIPPT